MHSSLRPSVYREKSSNRFLQHFFRKLITAKDRTPEGRTGGSADQQLQAQQDEEEKEKEENLKSLTWD